MNLFAPSLGRWQGRVGMERCKGHSNTVVLQAYQSFHHHTNHTGQEAPER